MFFKVRVLKNLQNHSKTAVLESFLITFRYFLKRLELGLFTKFSRSPLVAAFVYQQQIQFWISIDTRLCFNVDALSYELVERRVDVETIQNRA